MASLANQLDRHLADCMSVRIETRDALKALNEQLEDIKELPMKAVRWIGSIIVVAVITVVVQNFVLHNETNQQTAAAAQQASAAAQQGQQVAKVLGAPIVPTPKAPAP